MARGRSAGEDAISTTLLDAARQLLTSEGASALTVRRIAHTAGVSTMCVYSRFGCKEGVVEELFVTGFHQLAATIDESPRSSDPIVDLFAFAESYRRFAIANPTLYAVMFDRAVPDFKPSDEALAVANGTLQLLEIRLQAAMEEGLVAHADLGETAACLWGMCHGIVSLEMKICKEIDWPGTYRSAYRTMLAGMAVHEASNVEA